MSAVLSWEAVDRRVLAAVVFTDPLGLPVQSRVSVRALTAGVRLFNKRPGDVVIAEVPGLSAYTVFDLPATGLAPALGSVEVVLDVKPADPALGARRVTVKLPRDPDSTKPKPSATPVLVPLFAAPAAVPRGLCAAVRVSLHRADDGRAIEHGLVRLRPDGLPEQYALTDAAGEALFLTAGVPLTSPGAGATVKPDIGGVVDAIVDPALALFHFPGEITSARAAARTRTSGFVDPADLVARLAAKATPTVAVRITSGETSTTHIDWTTS
jgi:hypothetical protein